MSLKTLARDRLMLRNLLIGCLVVLFLLPTTRTAADEIPLSRIAFGSCIKQDKPQPIWDGVVEMKPQLFVLLGDNIYGDTTDMQVLREKYALLGNSPGYRKLKDVCPIVATWDDHDYGANDAGSEYPMKRESQKVFLDFFDVPEADPRRKQEGVYSARVFGPAGKRVQLILLDTRYFRSPLKLGFKAGEPGEGVRGQYARNTDLDATVLGATQWQWLEEQLNVPAEVRVIGSSIQFVANDHGFECWENFPHERSRFLKLLADSKANGVVIISGDRHLAEMSRMESSAQNRIGYPLFDITSSSLNAPSGNFTKSGTRFVNEINAHRIGLEYFDTNFGAILIDWDQPDPVIRLQVRDEMGSVALQHRVSLSKLDGGN